MKRLVLVLAALTACRPAAAQDLRVVADSFVAATDFQGVVIVADDDSAMFTGTYGFEDIEAGVPTRLDTRYQLGSIAKWITTLAVFTYVDDGALSLSKPIATYLPGYRSDTGARLTLHHLLTHSSGLPNDIVAAIQADPSVLNESLETMEAVRRYASGDLAFEPGSRFDYSHSNWIVVKAVLERVAGRPFKEVIRERITAPLGLRDTGVFWGDGSDVPRLAAGYEQVDPVPHRMDLSFPAYLAAAGGIYGTAPDLWVLLAALYDGRLLEGELLGVLDTVHWADEEYAYGGRVHRMDVGCGPETVLWHTGSNGPFKTRVSRGLSSGYSVITLTNVGVEPEETGELVVRLLRAACNSARP